MILHAEKCIFHPLPPQYWRGLEPVMQLHEKRYMKRAGEAGIALRAGSISVVTTLRCPTYKSMKNY
ncbi:hypothetical protein FG174_00405 [Serratia marcescens]|nr:hypothetical protein FG174_00405 [Serratia marcescens]